jgi:hypothetical protein
MATKCDACQHWDCCAEIQCLDRGEKIEMVNSKFIPEGVDPWEAIKCENALIMLGTEIDKYEATISGERVILIPISLWQKIKKEISPLWI